MIHDFRELMEAAAKSGPKSVSVAAADENETLHAVEYAYAMIEKREGSAVIILRVDNPEKAVMSLQKRNIRLLTREDIALL